MAEKQTSEQCKTPDCRNHAEASGLCVPCEESGMRATAAAAEQKHTEKLWRVKEDIQALQFGSYLVYVGEWKKTGLSIVPYLSGYIIARTTSKNDANQIAVAYNNTYAAGLNPAAVPGSVAMLERCYKELSNYAFPAGSNLNRLAPAIGAALAAAKKVEGE